MGATAPAYTIGGITRPALHFDATGHIILDPAAASFAATYGIKALYMGLPASTPYPPVAASLSAPTDIDAGANSIVEGAAANTSVHLKVSATNNAGSAVTYSLVGDTSGGGFKINATTGVVTVADPAKIDFETSAGHAYSITVKASDGILTSTQTFKIGVTDVAPSAVTDSDATANSVAEGAGVNTHVGITAHATDINGPAVKYSLTGDTSGGGFKIDAVTGVVSVADPSKIDYESSPGHAYTITTTASDGTLTNSQTFTIGVADVPLPSPTDSNLAANTVAEGSAAGTTVGLTASAVDPNGPTTTYSLIGDTSGGGFTINAATGVVTIADSTKIDYESAPGHAYSVTVKADDGLATTSQSFTVAVSDVAPSTPVDNDPAAATVVEGAANGSTVGVTALSSDVNGPPVTYALIGDTSGGGFTINAATGIITVADSTRIDYESAPGHTYTVTAQASDGTLANSQTFTIAVTDVAPTAPTDSDTAHSDTVVEGAANGSTVGVTAHSTDVNGGTLTYTLVGDTSGGGFTINAATGVVTVADATMIDYEAAPGHAYTITAQASDGLLTNSQVFTIGVTDAPPSTPTDSDTAANTVVEGAANGSTVGVTAHSVDVNGPAVTYSLVADTSGGGFTINAATGVITVADANKIDYETSGGSYTVVAQANDGTLTNSQAFVIAVTDAAPSTPVDSDAAAATVVEGAANGLTVGVTASSTDINGPAVTYSLTGDTSGGGFTINAATGIITVADSTKIDYESASGHAYTVTAQASDGTLTTSEHFTIAVTDVAPTAPTDSDIAHTDVVLEGGANGSTVGITAHSTDVNGGAVTYSLVGDTSGGGFTINATTGVVTVADTTKIDYESAPGHAYTITAQASDGVLTNSQVFTIGVSDAPPSTPTDSDTAANTVVEGAANGSTVGVTAHSVDVNGPAVTYSLVSDTSGGGFTINPATGVVTVADATKLDYESSGGSYTVVAQASDGTLANSQAFVMTVTDVAPSTPTDNDAGTNQVAVSAPAGSHVGITALSTDVNGPSVTYSLVGDTSGGGFTINAATGVVTVADPSKILIADPSYDITVDASDGTLHTQQAFTIAVVLDAAPVVTAGHTLAYTENQAATAIDTALTVTDSDNATLDYATVQITGGYVNGEDVLGFTDTASITHSFDAATGTLTLTGTDTVADYQAALAAVTYHNTSDNPSGAARTVTITANDGTLDSAPVTDTINVTPVNDPPVVVAGHTLNYTENQAATAFDPAIAVSDVDNANLASATVQITGNYASGEDVLGFANQNGIIGSFNAGTGTLSLTGSATVANYQAALASVTYLNSSENPSGLDRTVTITTNDGTANSTAVTDTIHVTPVDDAPVTSAGGALNYTENQVATAIDATVNVSDVDSANMASATVAITTNFAAGQDVLGFTDQNGIHGSYNAATGLLTLTGSSSVANYKTALDSVTYFNSSDNPSGLDRTVSYTVNDGSLDSNTSISTVHVTPVNDAPVVAFGAITGFTEPPNGTPAANSVPVTIAPSLAITDVDSSNLTSATFVLNDLKPSDALSISGHAGASGDIGGIHFNISGTAGTETVTLTGTDTLAHYNSVLDLIQFNNTSENPDATARSYTLTAVDDGATGGANNNTGSASTNETVTAVNDAPTATVPTDASLGTAFSHTNFAISGLSTADVDSGSGNVTATISALHAGLTFDTTGLSGSGGIGTHAVTLTGTAAQVNTALATLNYNSDDGFTGSDTVTLSVNDNGNTGTPGAQTSATGTFHVGVVPQVFYIDNNHPGSSNVGTQANPFTSIAAFNSANSAGSGDYVVLEHGTGTYTEANGINLADGVNLVGGSQTLTFTNPVTSQVVTANTGSGTDPIIKVSGGSDSGIDLLTGTTGHTISHISIDTTAGSGDGISDSGTSVGTVAMSNIAVSTASGKGLDFTHGGTITATGTNSISSTTGTALDVEHTNIGAGNLTFQSISSGSASNSSATGIILDTTGSAGGLHVTGTGTTAGSGGTIQHKTGADGATASGNGIYLNSTSGVQLADMQLNDFQNYGISGTNVTGFTLDHTVVNGTNGTLQGGIGEGDVYFTGLSGSATISNSTLIGAAYDALHVFNDAGQTLNRITVTGSTIGTVSGALNSSNDAIAFQATGGTFNATVQGSTVNSARGDLFQLNLLGTVSSDLDLGGATTALGNTFINGNQNIVSGGGGITIGGGGPTNNITLTYDIAHNTIKGALGAPLAVTKGTGTNASFIGTIDSNTIGTQGVAGSGSTQGIGINVFQDGAGVSNTTITNNHISGVVGGIYTQVKNGAGGEMTEVIQGNTVDTLDSANGFSGIYVQTGSNTTNSTPDNNLSNITLGGAGALKNSVDLGGNTGGAIAAGIVVEQEGISKVGLIGSPNYAGAPYDFTAIQNYVAGNNTVTGLGNGATNVFAFADPNKPAGYGYFGGAQFMLAAPGGVQASTPTTGEMHLTMAELNSVVAAAIAAWAAAGATASQLAALHATTFSIADLSSSVIGQETAPAHITIDTNADGNGWFVDPTPTGNSEYTHAQNAARTDLLTDPSNAAAGHMDLLTTVMHELGHVIGLPDSTATADVNDLMYIGLVDGERRLPGTADVVISIEAALPLAAQAPVGTSLVAGTAGNDIIHAGHVGAILFGGAGADRFVFDQTTLASATASTPHIDHIADYSAAQGDVIDFTALFSGASVAHANPLTLVHAVEDASGTLAELQINTAAAGKPAHWVDIAQLDGMHTGDAVALRLDHNHPSATVKIQSETAAMVAQDNFAFATTVQTPVPAAAPVQHSFGTFDFSALTAQFFPTSLSDEMVVRAVEDHSGKFATLQVNSNSMGLKYGPTWVNVEQIAGAHLGDAVSVVVDNHSSVHLAHIHVDLLV